VRREGEIICKMAAGIFLCELGVGWAYFGMALLDRGLRGHAPTTNAIDERRPIILTHDKHLAFFRGSLGSPARLVGIRDFYRRDI
jgi:hypothetical protein